MGSIVEAIQFLEEKVYLPALASAALSDDLKASVKKSQDSVHTMTKVGDLYRYLKRFTIDDGIAKNIGIHKGLKSFGLFTLEECLPLFEKRFVNELFDATTLNDFIIGKSYASTDIANAAGTYNIQSGITPVGEAPHCTAVFVKGEIGGDRYANNWIVPDLELQYYFYSIKGNYSPTYKYNAAILETPNVPVYVFIKEEYDYEFKGIFRLEKPVFESDGKNWFHLIKLDVIPKDTGILEPEYQRDFAARLAKAKKLTDEQAFVAASVSRPPEFEQVVSYRRKRSAVVVDATLRRANGACEDCNSPAPFLRSSDGTPYLEVHHVITLAKGGEDILANTKALCPNCHRKRHHGS